MLRPRVETVSAEVRYSVIPDLSQYNTVPFPAALLHLDLSGYGKTTKQQGHEAAALRRRELARVADDVRKAHNGHQVGDVGDSVTVLFPSVTAACCGAYYALYVLRGRAKAGIAWGDVQIIDGAWFGNPWCEGSDLPEKRCRPGEVRLTVSAKKRLDEEHKPCGDG